MKEQILFAVEKFLSAHLDTTDVFGSQAPRYGTQETRSYSRTQASIMFFSG